MFGFDAQTLTAWRLLLAQSDEGPMKMVAEGPQSNFQPFIFWAYGLACLLLLLFTAWTVMQVRALDQRVEQLKSRFEDRQSRRIDAAAGRGTDD